LAVKILIAYFIVINLIGMLVNIADKQKARHNKWRIKERTLWAVALLGGAPLTYITMKTIRHKTKHTGFMVGMPILAVIDIAALSFLILKLTGRI